ncbi:hypothetical protein K1T71_007103 [Dendrolimus kikuchii]|uniref:Uncharacterized protein n=1 Tax=Dendrolimus kikuchii TaxID=765133 RepID=A0ACC1CZH5_9NEOP|nr:hypothetical protein K1T71_007103 [Dendrolimus kikuchii]
MDCNHAEFENNSSSRTKDPVFLLSLINKYAKVQLISNTAFIGFINSIDPLTKSVILSIPKQDAFQTALIPGYAVLNISEEIQPIDIKPPERKQTLVYEDVLVRKATLLSWFKFNRLPVSESGDDIIFGSVRILPPYNTADLCTENPIVALQVKKIIEEMPQGFNS